MRKILLTIDRFEHYGQHESIFFDLIEYFHRHNWQVDVFAKTTGRYWLNNLNVINENKTIRLLEQPDGQLHAFYDLMWIFNGYIPAELNTIFMQGDWVSESSSITFTVTLIMIYPTALMWKMRFPATVLPALPLAMSA
jgi:hypothetical protein